MTRQVDIGENTHLFLEHVFLISETDNSVPEFPFRTEKNEKIWAAGIVESAEVFQQFLEHRKLPKDKFHIREINPTLLKGLISYLKGRGITCRIIFLNPEKAICSGPTDVFVIEERV